MKVSASMLLHAASLASNKYHCSQLLMTELYPIPILPSVVGSYTVFYMYRLVHVHRGVCRYLARYRISYSTYMYMYLRLLGAGGSTDAPGMQARWPTMLS